MEIPMLLFSWLTSSSFADTDTDVAPAPAPVEPVAPVAVATEAAVAVPVAEASMNVDLQKVFTSPDAYLTVILVVIAVTLLKRTVASINKTLLERPQVKVAFEWAGPVIAVGLAALPGLWDQFPHPVDFAVALPCGFFAERVYKSVLSRFLPAGWVMSSDAPSRASDKPIVEEVAKALDKTSFENLDQVIGHLVMSSEDGITADEVQQALKKLLSDGK